MSETVLQPQMAMAASVSLWRIWSMLRTPLSPSTASAKKKGFPTRGRTQGDCLYHIGPPSEASVDQDWDAFPDGLHNLR